MDLKSTFYLPENVLKLIDIFGKSNHRLDIVGGCVRDFLIGTEPHDFDMTTSATPSEMKEILKGCKIIETGIKHGTLTVLLSSEPYEITTYRIDGDYEDNRHPTSVTFSRDIANDLSRRDFTVNAIAYNPTDGITDLFDGVTDIKNRVIRSVGEADKRFSEDALRILRAIRFSSTLGFTVEPATASSALKNRALLENVSKERILSEWQKLLMGKNALSVISEYLPIINTFLPEIKSIGTLTQEGFSKLDFTERQCTLFFLSGASKNEYSRAMRTLKSDSKTRISGLEILEALEYLLGLEDPLSSDPQYQRLLADCGEPSVSALKILEAAGTPRGSSEYARALISRGAPYRICDLTVNGDDLKSAGISGEKIGSTLKLLLYKVIDGALENSREILLDYTKNN